MTELPQHGTPEHDELCARVRARRMARGAPLDALPDTEAGRRVEALVPNHLPDEVAKAQAIAERRAQAEE